MNNRKSVLSRTPGHYQAAAKHALVARLAAAIRCRGLHRAAHTAQQLRLGIIINWLQVVPKKSETGGYGFLKS